MDWRLEIHDRLGSTNDACIARATAGEAAGLAVLAHRQTSARGSRGRGWVEPPSGNLALSVLLRPDLAAEPIGWWPFLAGLALIDGLMAVSPARLMLKWPNDVLLEGRKLAGILIERDPARSAPWLVIGFGANLAHAPVLPDRTAACLAEAGPAPSAEAAAARVLSALTDWREHGFATIRQAWLDRAHPIGTRLAVCDRDGQTEGSFLGLAPDGALLLGTGGGTRRIATGDVLLLGGNP